MTPDRSAAATPAARTATVATALAMSGPAAAFPATEPAAAPPPDPPPPPPALEPAAAPPPASPPAPPAPDALPRTECSNAAEATAGSGANAARSRRRSPIEDWNARHSEQSRRWARMSRRFETRPSAVGELPADPVAAHLPALLHLAQAEPGLVDGLARDRGRGVERGADLLEAEARQLAHHQRRALALGQLVEVGEQCAQPLARSPRSSATP